MILFSAFLLVAASLSVHIAGLTVLVEFYGTHRNVPRQFWAIFAYLCPLAWSLIIMHGIEIVTWAAYYWWSGCLPNFETAWYFSGATYTTLGYGDVVLLGRYRLLGPIEGLVGILMSSLSGAVFIALLSRIFSNRIAANRPPA